jgi:hypothetical protein
VNKYIKIYMAGKIEKNCWRHSITNKLRSAEDKPFVISDNLIYNAPFFIGCDLNILYPSCSFINNIS